MPSGKSLSDCIHAVSQVLHLWFSDVFTNVSELSGAPQGFRQPDVRIFFKNVPKFSRPLNSGMVDGTNVPILVDQADASSMGAAVAGAVARPLFYIYRSSVANCSSVKFAVPLPSSFKNSLLCSTIFCLSSPEDSYVPQP